MTDCAICYQPVEYEIECSICHSKIHRACWKMVTDKDTCPYCHEPIDVDIIYIKVYNIHDIKRTESESIEVIDMEIDRRMFAESKFKNIKFVNCKTTANVSELFGCSEQLKTLDLSGLDTSNATDMNGMFAGCSSLQTLDLSNFDTCHVTNMHGMFSECLKIKTIIKHIPHTGHIRSIEIR